MARNGPDHDVVDAAPIGNLGPPTNLLLMNNRLKHLDHVHTPEQLENHWLSSGPAPSVIYCEPFYNDFATVLGLAGTAFHPQMDGSQTLHVAGPSTSAHLTTLGLAVQDAFEAAKKAAMTVACFHSGAHCPEFEEHR